MKATYDHKARRDALDRAQAHSPFLRAAAERWPGLGRALLLEAISTEQCQILVTSAGDEPLDHPALARLPVVQVEAGTKIKGSSAV